MVSWTSDGSDDPSRQADRREDDADAREADADRRERQMDARERVLDRWEREIIARAAAFSESDDAEGALTQAREQRGRESAQRRAQADARRDAAIEREVLRSERAARGTAGPPCGDEMVDPATSFARLATALRTTLPLDEVLQLILAVGVDTVPDCAAASIALVTSGRLDTAATSASWAADLDALQLRANAGPLVEVAAGSAVVSTASLATDERWPALAATSHPDAARAAVCLELSIDGRVAGVLTLYARGSRDFSSHALSVGGMLAAHAAVTLGRTLDRLTHRAQAEAWQHALASRDVIGQAKGILMQQRATTADDAFDLLRLASQRLNIKLRDVAGFVVDERRLPDE